MAVTKIGRYEVVRLLNKGPRSETYLAEDRQAGQKVAVKVLSLRGDADAFVENARKVAAMSHPSIALCQVGLHDDDPFVATEYLPGSNLRDWLKPNRPLAERLAVVDGVADALNHAHQQGVVHHGVKPSNVQVLPDGTCRLYDFGAPPSPSGISGPGAAYLAPEVLQGGASTDKSDIYSAGALFYEVLAGENPFARGTPKATAEAVLNDNPAHLRERRRDLDRDLADAIMVCLEKDPDWRPKDLTYILELVRKLGPAKGGARKAGRAAAPGGASLASFGGRRAPSTSPSRLPLVAGLVVLIGAAAGAAWWFLLRGDRGPTPRPSPRVATAPTPAETGAPSPQVEAVPTPVPTAAPAQAGARETPGVAPTPTAHPVVASTEPTPTPTPPVATMVATGERVEVPVTRVTPLAPARPTAAAPMPAPETRPDPPPPTTPVEPPVLRTVTPPTVKRNATGILDIRGSGLRADLQIRISKGRDAAAGIRVVRQRLVNPGLLQVAILVDASASTGAYTVSVADGSGQPSNSLRLEVTK